MDGWMNEWIDRWTDEWKMDGLTEGCIMITNIENIKMTL